jgi:hypothetical protein
MNYGDAVRDVEVGNVVHFRVIGEGQRVEKVHCHVDYVHYNGNLDLTELDGGKIHNLVSKGREVGTWCNVGEVDLLFDSHYADNQFVQSVISGITTIGRFADLQNNN